MYVFDVFFKEYVCVLDHPRGTNHLQEGANVPPPPKINPAVKLLSQLPKILAKISTKGFKLQYI